MQGPSEYLRRQSKPMVIAIGLGLVVVLGEIDFLTGWELSFAVFYLLPIFLVVHYAGKWPGFVVSVASAVSWFVADVLTDPPYSHFFFHYWNTLVRLSFFLICTFLLASREEALEREKELNKMIWRLKEFVPPEEQAPNLPG
jgi:hypothetical protein